MQAHVEQLIIWERKNDVLRRQVAEVHGELRRLRKAIAPFLVHVENQRYLFETPVPISNERAIDSIYIARPELQPLSLQLLNSLLCEYFTDVLLPKTSGMTAADCQSLAGDAARFCWSRRPRRDGDVRCHSASIAKLTSTSRRHQEKRRIHSAISDIAKRLKEQGGAET